MFSPKRLLKFLRRFLSWVAPLFICLVLLALLGVLVGNDDLTLWQIGLRVAAAMIPAALAIAGGFALSIAYMQKLHDLGSKREIFGYLIHCMFGQGNFKPWLLVQEGKVNNQRNAPDSLIVRVGGPGHLVIRKDSAVVLEQGGRLTRVEEPGFPRLEPYERIYDTVDLRPIRWVYPVSGMSKEGIPVTCDADISFQIKNGDQKATDDVPYPMDRQAVFTAVTSKWLREASRPEGDRMLDWKGLIIISSTEGILRSILARHPLDRLVAPEKEGLEHSREAIRRELETELKIAADRVGGRVLKVELGQIKVADAITQQWIETWRAEWDRWQSIYMAPAEAAYVESVGGARAELIAQRITNTAKILHELAGQGQRAFVSGALTQFFLGMRNIGTDSLAMTYLAPEAVKMLQRTADLTLPSGTHDVQDGKLLKDGDS